MKSNNGNQNYNPSDDAVLAVRRGVYEVSVAHRTGGWKGFLL